MLNLNISKGMSFLFGYSDKVSFITLIKKALGIFFRTKHMMNSKHEFALMFLDTSSAWASRLLSYISFRIWVLYLINQVFWHVDSISFQVLYQLFLTCISLVAVVVTGTYVQ